MACVADVSRAAAAPLCSSSSSSLATCSLARPLARVALASPASNFFTPGAKALSVATAPKALLPNGGPLVVSMSKRDEELVDIRKMSEEEINTAVVDLKGELFLLRSKQATRQEFKSSEFRRIRRNIARMMTVKREREIERGIGPRESRKLDKAWKRGIVMRPPPAYAATLAELQKKK